MDFQCYDITLGSNNQKIYINKRIFGVSLDIPAADRCSHVFIYLATRQDTSLWLTGVRTSSSSWQHGRTHPCGWPVFVRVHLDGNTEEKPGIKIWAEAGTASIAATCSLNLGKYCIRDLHTGLYYIAPACIDLLCRAGTLQHCSMCRAGTLQHRAMCRAVTIQHHTLSRADTLQHHAVCRLGPYNTMQYVGWSLTTPPNLKRRDPTTPLNLQRRDPTTPRNLQRSDSTTPRNSQRSDPTTPRNKQGCDPTTPRNMHGCDPTTPRIVHGCDPTTPRNMHGCDPTTQSIVQGSIPAPQCHLPQSLHMAQSSQIKLCKLDPANHPGCNSLC